MKDTLLPVPGDRESRINSYMDRHERYVRETKESESEILFIGDSLIEHLVQTDIWDQFSQMHALNFGISGDKTQNVLWRIKNGELDFEDNKPKAVILLIGTNNTESTEDIVDGIIEIIKEIQIKLPNSYILVMSLFPKGQYPCPERSKIASINSLLAGKLYFPKLVDLDPTIDQSKDKIFSSLVRFVDLDPGFVQSDGRINHHDMYDYLHLTKRGYERAFSPLIHILQNLIYEQI